METKSGCEKSASMKRCAVICTPIEVSESELSAGVPVFELMRRAGLAKSNGEARRLIKGGGARVNDERLDDEAASISLAQLSPDGVIKLSAGRKRHALVRPLQS